MSAHDRFQPPPRKGLWRTARVPCVAIASALTTIAACSDAGFGNVHNTSKLVIVIDKSVTATGSPSTPLAVTIDKPTTFRVSIQAVNPDGSQDTSFTRSVRISAKPGAIAPLQGQGAEGRNIYLREGQSAPIDVALSNAYGIAYIVADDLGYVPADPLAKTPPECSNGIDDDGDGRIDLQADDGCAYANDDDERGGTFAQGVSDPIYFALPRIADVRGVGVTPYRGEPIQLDTGFRDDGTFIFDTVVMRISSDGFYVTDVSDPRKAFTSLYAFNFNAPPRMRTCDRLKTLGGTATEFFGLTQIGFPTWTLEEWIPSQRPCLVPEPTRLVPDLLARLPASAPDLLRLSASLVRVETNPDGSQRVKIAPKFGPGDTPLVREKIEPPPPAGEPQFRDVYRATPEASNCDFNKNGRIEFPPFDEACTKACASDSKSEQCVKCGAEAKCSTECAADAECAEWSNFATRGVFRLTVTDKDGRAGGVQADTSAAPEFDAFALKGKELRAFTGTLHYFSGGTQFTVQARCSDDVIASLSDKPFVTDSVCATDADCTNPPPTGLGLPAIYTCVSLARGKACRKIDPSRAAACSKACTDNAASEQCRICNDERTPPPLACVFPRTSLDNNPQ